MTNNALPTGAISAAQFYQYAAKWLTLVSSPDSTELTRSFLADNTKLLLVRFPIEQIVELLSAVGVRHLKARFLIVPNEANAVRFAVGLYATSAHGERLSAYYFAEGEALDSSSPPDQSGNIPNPLAEKWLTQWKNAVQVTSALFTTSAGPLEGYNFKVKDILAPLLEKQSFDEIELRLSFGLSNYYAAASEQLTQTFGLLMRVHDTRHPGATGFYDMSTPCPPGH